MIWDEAGEHDRLLFLGVLKSDISQEKIGNNLILTDVKTGHMVVIQDYYAGGGMTIEFTTKSTVQDMAAFSSGSDAILPMNQEPYSTPGYGYDPIVSSTADFIG